MSNVNVVRANAVYMDSENMSPAQFIEKIGRICYKSEDKITDTSAEKFIKMLESNKHYAMLEHYHIYIKAPSQFVNRFSDRLNKLYSSINVIASYNAGVRNFVNITINGDDDYKYGYISGSIRAFLELSELSVLQAEINLDDVFNSIAKAIPEFKDKFSNNKPIESDIKILTPKQFIEDVKSGNNVTAANEILRKHLTHTVLFTCDRGVTHELVRHRVASYAMESTRYCNYSKGKFDSKITVVQPVFWQIDSPEYNAWLNACIAANDAYISLINNGAAPQQARDILPHSVKADIVITATETEWQHILNLRLHGKTGTPHPQMVEIMQIIYPTLVEKSDKRLS